MGQLNDGGSIHMVLTSIDVKCCIILVSVNCLGNTKQHLRHKVTAAKGLFVFVLG